MLYTGSKGKVCVPVRAEESRGGQTSQTKRIVSRPKTHKCMIVVILHNKMSYDETKTEHNVISIDTATKKPNFTEIAKLF